MAQYRSPTPLNFQEPRWDVWRAQFETFRKVTKLDKEDSDVQVASLKYCMGPEAEEVFLTFGLSKSDAIKYDIVLKKYDEYFKPKINIIRLRRIFQRRLQQANENEECYIRALFVAAEDCGFGELKTERIRDQFIAGIQDNILAEKLEHLYMSNTSNFTLSSVIEFTRTYCDIKEGRRQEKYDLAISEVKRSSSRAHSDRQPNSSRSRAHSDRESNSGRTRAKCNYCGYQHQQRKCPAFGRQCDNCGKLNHFSRVCKMGNNVQEITSTSSDIFSTYSNKLEDHAEDDEPGDHYFLGECFYDRSRSWHVDVVLNDKHVVNFKVDTGADVSVINYRCFSSCNLGELNKPVKKLFTPAGELKYLGSVKCCFRVKNDTIEEELYVTSNNSKTCNLLSRNAAERLKLVKFLGNVNIEESLFGFGEWETEPVKFFIKPDVVPHSEYTARKISFNLLEPVKQALKKMTNENIIETVRNPTDWTSGIVPVLKPNKTVRICVDFRKLNLGLKRETFHIPTFDELSYKLSGVRLMSKLDAASGFYQIPLDESARNYTAFITPFGRFRFKKLPMGINIAPEIYQRKMCELLEGIEGVLIYMDDVLVFGKTVEEHNRNLKEVLERIKNSGLKLNKDKCDFNKTQINFLGHIISNRGIKICPEKTAAISALKTPSSSKELKRFLGMVNFVSRFIPNVQNNLAPLNELLRKDVVWCWGEPQDVAFKTIKESLCNAATLSYFNPKNEIVVSADSSSYALGGVLLQRENDTLRPIAYCSRMLSSTERNYAQIEKELLASVWACEKFDVYLQGIDFKLQTDHKPLVSLISKKSLIDAPIRCQRLLMRLSRYSPIVNYVPGQNLVIADTLSRDVGFKEDVCSIRSGYMENEINTFEKQFIGALPATSKKLRVIISEQMGDSELKNVRNYILNGWPEDCNSSMQTYYEKRHEFSIIDDLLVLNDRIVIPNSMRIEILKRIHDDGHLSLNKCRKRIHSSVWWPNISKQLSEYINNCQFCQIYRRRNRKEPMKSTELPSGPWVQLGLDLFELNNFNYLIVVDYFSRWFECIKLNDITSQSVIMSLKYLFSIFGIPECIKSDGGLQFNSMMFKNFASEYDFKHILSDPYCPQANGCAERAVQTAKRLLKQSDPIAALMAYRVTPLDSTGFSPSQLLLGRNIRTKLPTLPSNLTPKWPDFTVVKNNDSLAKEASTDNYNRRHGARPLPVLHDGQQVRIRLPNDKQWSDAEQLLSRRGASSYIVRNRRHLQPIPSVQTPSKPESSSREEDDTEGGEGTVGSSDEQPMPAIQKPTNISRYGRIIKPVLKYQAG